LQLTTPGGTPWPQTSQDPAAPTAPTNTDVGGTIEEAEELLVPRALEQELDADADEDADNAKTDVSDNDSWSSIVLRNLFSEAQRMPHGDEPRPALQKLAALAKCLDPASPKEVTACGSDTAPDMSSAEPQTGAVRPKVPGLNLAGVQTAEDDEDTADEEDFESKVGHAAAAHSAAKLPRPNSQEKAKQREALGVPPLKLSNEGPQVTGGTVSTLKPKQLQTSASAVEFRSLPQRESDVRLTQTAGFLPPARKQNEFITSPYIADQVIPMLQQRGHPMRKETSKSSSVARLPPLHEQRQMQPAKQLRPPGKRKVAFSKPIAVVHAHVHHHYHVFRSGGGLQSVTTVQDSAPLLAH